MSQPEFLYVQWLTAKRMLIERLYHCNQKQDAVDLVTKFFENHIFEVGVELSIDEQFSRRKNSEEMMHFQRRQGIGHMLDALMEKGLYMMTPYNQVEGEHVYKSQMTILVCGTPKIVGPGTRKL